MVGRGIVAASVRVPDDTDRRRGGAQLRRHSRILVAKRFFDRVAEIVVVELIVADGVAVPARRASP